MIECSPVVKQRCKSAFLQVGFINAFVLRNVMKRLNRAVLACYDSLDLQVGTSSRTSA